MGFIMKKKTKTKAGRPATGRIRRHIVFDPDVLKHVIAAATNEGRGLSDQVNFILRNALKLKK